MHVGLSLRVLILSDCKKDRKFCINFSENYKFEILLKSVVWESSYYIIEVNVVFRMRTRLNLSVKKQILFFGLIIVALVG